MSPVRDEEKKSHYSFGNFGIKKFTPGGRRKMRIRERLREESPSALHWESECKFDGYFYHHMGCGVPNDQP